jgi:hypothetical protein
MDRIIEACVECKDLDSLKQRGIQNFIDGDKLSRTPVFYLLFENTCASTEEKVKMLEYLVIEKKVDLGHRDEMGESGFQYIDIFMDNELPSINGKSDIICVKKNL